VRVFDRERKTEESVVGGEAMVAWVDINVLRLFGLDLGASEGKVSKEEKFEGVVFEKAEKEEEDEAEEEAVGGEEEEVDGGEGAVLSG
jgi:hypothetical protein